MKVPLTSGSDQGVRSIRDGSICELECDKATGSEKKDATEVVRDGDRSLNSDDLRSPVQTGRSGSPPLPKPDTVSDRGRGRNMEDGWSERHWRRRWRASDAAVGRDAPHTSHISRRRHAARMRRCRHRLLNCVYDFRQTSQRNGFSTATFLLPLSSPVACSLLWVAHASWKSRLSPEVTSFTSALTGNGSCCGVVENATSPDITNEFCNK